MIFADYEINYPPCRIYPESRNSTPTTGGIFPACLSGSQYLAQRHKSPSIPQRNAVKPEESTTGRAQLGCAGQSGASKTPRSMPYLAFLVSPTHHIRPTINICSSLALSSKTHFTLAGNAQVSIRKRRMTTSRSLRDRCRLPAAHLPLPIAYSQMHYPTSSSEVDKIHVTSIKRIELQQLPNRRIPVIIYTTYTQLLKTPL